MNKLTKIFSHLFMLAFSQLAQAAIPMCHDVNMAAMSSEFKCRGNSGTVFHKVNAGSWQTRKHKWHTNLVELLPHRDAKKYCEDMGMRFPTTTDYRNLSSELMNPVTKKLPLMFPVHVKDQGMQHEYWTADLFSSHLAYIYNPATGKTDARYFLEHPFRVMCVE